MTRMKAYYKETVAPVLFQEVRLQKHNAGSQARQDHNQCRLR